MQSLNAQFKQAIVENLYNYSNFDGKQYPLEDLQICHILSKSKRTKNAIKKAYNCSDKTAEIIINMPLLNTVVGSREQNKAYCKTEDITFIDCWLCFIVWNEIVSKYDDNDFNINVFNELIFILREVANPLAISIQNKDFKPLFTNMIKDIQLQFHKEIDLHF